MMSIRSTPKQNSTFQELQIKLKEMYPKIVPEIILMVVVQ